MWTLIWLACSPQSTPAPPVVDPTDSGSPDPTETVVSTGHTGGSTTVPLTGVGALQFRGDIPRNVLMISVDTFRKDHLDRYGGPSLTPALDELMTQGVAFDLHRQCSNWTFPTTSCTILGRYHEENGFIPQLSESGRAPFANATPFLAAQLRDAGVRTIIGSNNSWLSVTYNNVQGYSSILPRTSNTTEQLDQGLAEIQSGAGPWFFHAHVTEPHVPYAPPDEYLNEVDALPPIAWDLTRSDAHYEARDDWPNMTPEEQDLVLEHMKARYRADIRWLDDQIRDGLARFEDAGLLDDTLVVIWNDHGEQFWEHGNLTHAYDLHREENAAFLFFWSKNIVPATWTEPTHAVDLVPTLLALKGITPAGPLSGDILGTADPLRPTYALTVARSGGISSVTRGYDRLIYNWKSGTFERYEMVSDPMEENNLFDPTGVVDLELWSLLEPHVQLATDAAPLVPIVWPAEL